MNSKAVAVMVSGRGSNLKVILESVARGECPADVKLVISNRAVRFSSAPYAGHGFSKQLVKQK